jgi:hypothetical protein
MTPRVTKRFHTPPGMPTTSGADAWQSFAEVTAARGRYMVRITWRLVRGRYEPSEVAVTGLDGAVVSPQVLRELPSGGLIADQQRHLAEQLDQLVRGQVGDMLIQQVDAAKSAFLHPALFHVTELDFDQDADNATLLRQAATNVGRAITNPSDTDSVHYPAEQVQAFTAAMIAMAVEDGAVGKDDAVGFGAQRGRRLSPAVLEEVAHVYRQAHAVGEPKQAAVAKAMGISRSMAAKRIMAARQAGLLEGIGQ